MGEAKMLLIFQDENKNDFAAIKQVVAFLSLCSLVFTKNPNS